MTADEIREESSRLKRNINEQIPTPQESAKIGISGLALTFAGLGLATVLSGVQALCEIAAQLAELNERESKRGEQQ